MRAELGFELEEIDIGGDPELERAYRERLPVVEIDGEQAFTYFVAPGRRSAARLGALSADGYCIARSKRVVIVSCEWP